MPAEIFGERYEFLKREEILTFEEIVRLTGLFTEFGVRKVRITGGEPLVRSDVTTLIEELARNTGCVGFGDDDQRFLVASVCGPIEARRVGSS